MSASYLDHASYILENTGSISVMKLQKLMFYSQAWHIVWHEESLFEEDFQAWANGPVLPSLYNLHRGEFKVDAGFFSGANSKNLTATQSLSIDKVLSFYGEKTAQWLSNLTHQESPWLNARGSTPIGEPSNAVITKSSIHEYYSSI